MVKCEHLKEFLDVQIDIITKHIDNHKWCQHLGSENLAVKDFLEKYGWLMREFFCGHMCPSRDKCEIRPVEHETPEETKKKNPLVQLVETLDKK